MTWEWRFQLTTLMSNARNGLSSYETVITEIKLNHKELTEKDWEFITWGLYTDDLAKAQATKFLTFIYPLMVELDTSRFSRMMQNRILRLLINIEEFLK